MDTSFFADPHLAELAEVLKFTPEDLASNQQGFISENQYDSLKSMLRRRLEIGGALCALVVLYVGSKTLNIDSPGLSVCCLPILLAVFLIGTGSWGAIIYRRKLDQLEARSVDSTHFTIPQRLNRSGDVLITPSGLRFSIPYHLAQIVHRDETYLFYYLPPSYKRERCHILSMEPTGEEPYFEESIKLKQKPNVQYKMDGIYE